ncbi:hypothetical protein [Legionella gresilensis]|uniref:hypothetical protein n=1 Tax=Legionella gresilensis TaxID=91823 RepID=UPI00104154A0|nr:hypothetical protein [Legionella gresilensis]
MLAHKNTSVEKTISNLLDIYPTVKSINPEAFKEFKAYLQRYPGQDILTTLGKRKDELDQMILYYFTPALIDNDLEKVMDHLEILFINYWEKKMIQTAQLSRAVSYENPQVSSRYTTSSQNRAPNSYQTSMAHLMRPVTGVRQQPDNYAINHDAEQTTWRAPSRPTAFSNTLYYLPEMVDLERTSHKRRVEPEKESASNKYSKTDTASRGEKTPNTSLSKYPNFAYSLFTPEEDLNQEVVNFDKSIFDYQ